MIALKKHCFFFELIPTGFLFQRGCQSIILRRVWCVSKGHIKWHTWLGFALAAKTNVCAI